MATTFKLKRKCFAGKFDKGTFDAMQIAANNNATPDAKLQFDAYSKKYANEVAELNKTRQLATVPKTSTTVSVKPVTTPKPTTAPKINKMGVGGHLKGAWNSMSRTGKIGTLAAGTLAAGAMAKGLFGGKKKD